MTYISKKGLLEFTSVIDHIFAKGVGCKDHTYESWHDFVSLCEGCDHSPVLCTVVWSGKHDEHFHRRRVLPYDRKKIGNPELDGIFRQCIDMCPPVPYYIDTTTHCWIYNKCLVNAAKIAYPIDVKKKHQDYITNETFQLIRKANTVKKSMLRVDNRSNLLHVKSPLSPGGTFLTIRCVRQLVWLNRQRECKLGP